MYGLVAAMRAVRSKTHCFGVAIASFAFASLCFHSDIARAESLYEAMISAYVGNPALRAARAGLRATDEDVPRAKSGFRPTITGSGTSTFSNSNTSPSSPSDGSIYPKSLSVTLSQPIFRGFRTINSVREAEANVRAGRQDLKSTEQDTLLSAVTTYMDVVRDQAIVRLRKNNVQVLSEQLRATQDRFDVGEVTKTDVAQAKARHAGAVSLLSLARATLNTSRAEYERVVGNPPGGISQPGSLTHILPGSINVALDVGLEENPQIIAAKFRQKASRHAVDRIRGEFLPSVDLEASYAKSYDPSDAIDNSEATTVTGRLTVPLYQAGEVSARLRQSKHTFQQRRDEFQVAYDSVRSNVIASWSQLESAKAQLTSDRAEVEANRTALLGVREEEKVGQRTILDVLDAEQELLDSEVGLETTRRDYVIASFSLLSTLGRLTAADLGLAVEYYDPEEHYNAVRRKWFGTGPRLPAEDSLSGEKPGIVRY